MVRIPQGRNGDAPLILVVEDEQIVAEDIHRRLEGMGYRVAAVVSSGEEALRRLEEVHPDLVLMDIMLQGGMDGVKAVQEIHGRVDVPVIYLTAHTDEETVERAKLTGPLGFVLKPFDERELRFTIEMALYKHHAEKNLRDSEEIFRQMAENSNELYWMMDAGLSRTLYVNRAFEQIWGIPMPDAAAGLEFWIAAVHPEDRDRVLGMYNKARQGEFDDRGLEYRIARPDGSTRWLRTRSFPVKDSRGTIYRIAGTSHDITRQKWAWETLHESEGRYRLMADHSRDMISRHNAEGVFLYASPACRNLIGYKPEELLGHTLGEYIYPEDLRRILAAHGTLSDAFATGTITYRVRRKDGVHRWFESVAKIVRDMLSDEPREIIAVSRDIHERKETEEVLHRYEFIVNTSREFMTLINKEYVYEAANEAYCQAHGKLRTEVVGQSVASVWGEEAFRGVIKAYLDQCFGGNEVHYESWFTFDRLGRRCFDVKYYPYFDIHGVVTHCVVVSLDVTNRKNAEEQVRLSLQEKEVLLKEIHHRVKNNLQIVSSLLNLQMGVINNKETRELIRESQNRVRSMALIHEKLYQSDNLAQISFEDYLRSLTRDLFRSYSVGGVNLALTVEDIRLDVDTAIPCGLIVNELVSNALKYAFPDRKRGEIEIRCMRVSSDRIALSVSDDGIGLPANVNMQEASSLGFQLIQMLVKQLHGTIDVVRGGGTTVMITFPVHEQDKETAKAQGT